MLPVEMLEGEGQLARPMRFRSMPRFSGCRGTTFAGRRARWTPRRWHVVLALALAASAVMGLCWQFLPQVYAFVSDPVRVQSFCDEHALLSRLGLVGLNLLQIVLAVLPGEPIELASGYAFGFVEGTLLCLVASAAGSAMVFLAVRRWGRPLVELLFGRGEPVRFSWLMRSERLEPLMFAVFSDSWDPKGFPDIFYGADHYAPEVRDAHRHFGTYSQHRDLDHSGRSAWIGRLHGGHRLFCRRRVAHLRGRGCVQDGRASSWVGCGRLGRT